MWRLFGEFVFLLQFPIIAKIGKRFGGSTFCFCPTIVGQKRKGVASRTAKIRQYCPS